MPFKHPFRDRFHVGDLIYGLHNSRAKYIDNMPAFSDAKEHHDQSNVPPIFIDDYFLEREIIEEEIKTRPPLSVKLPKHINDPNYEENKNSFFNHLKHELPSKYNNIATNRRYPRYWDKFDKRNNTLCDSERDYVEKFEAVAIKDFGRKSKGGLSWAVTNGIYVHFILDDIDMLGLINKNKVPRNVIGSDWAARIDLVKSITGQELRWIFRNRGDSRVAAKIQFWLDGKPVAPPWVETPNFLQIISSTFNPFSSPAQRDKNIEKLKEDAAWGKYAEHVRQKHQNGEN
ncbi:hypothetical protein [Xenorhabdus sp. KJ12.1]|uniref:hypothetical protein n=1 Tax=Xenorhabdus sp. KJ12.1 TaxID=1851571 RepID=UPI000C04D86E|nr:hypothetical protein [Xenorhabdus sp. KJ12.1]PHM72589.1 T3SS effector EspK [Xenorhabdus sp. KJ12.1]